MCKTQQPVNGFHYPCLARKRLIFRGKSNWFVIGAGKDLPCFLGLEIPIATDCHTRLILHVHTTATYGHDLPVSPQ